MRFHFTGDALAVDEAFEELIRLNRLRWGAGGTSFRSPEYLAFHKVLATRFHDKGWLLLFLMSLNGRKIGARYDFVYGGKIWRACIPGR